MTIRFNNKFGKEILRRYDARTQGTRYGNVLRTLRRSLEGIARKGQDNGQGGGGAPRRFGNDRILLGVGNPTAQNFGLAENCRGLLASQNSGRFAARVSFVNKMYRSLVGGSIHFVYNKLRRERRSPSKFFDRPRRRRVLDRSRRRRRAFFLLLSVESYPGRSLEFPNVASRSK